MGLYTCLIFKLINQFLNSKLTGKLLLALIIMLPKITVAYDLNYNNMIDWSFYNEPYQQNYDAFGIPINNHAVNNLLYSIE